MNKYVNGDFFSHPLRAADFFLVNQRWRIYEEMLYESGPISLLSEIYPHSSEMQPSTFNKKKPPLWILNFIHFNLPFLSAQIQTYSTCFVKTLIDLWKLHLICENSNFTYWVIFRVNLTILPQSQNTLYKCHFCHLWQKNSWRASCEDCSIGQWYNYVICEQPLIALSSREH